MLETWAFLYLNPEPGVSEFAQCSTCRMWIRERERCTIHGQVKVTGTMSCGLYIYGEPIDNLETLPDLLVSPYESGLVDREVRCENCKWGGPNVYTCELFTTLNDKLGDIFDLETDIDPKGCCNAHQPRSS